MLSTVRVKVYTLMYLYLLVKFEELLLNLCFMMLFVHFMKQMVSVVVLLCKLSDSPSVHQH